MKVRVFWVAVALFAIALGCALAADVTGKWVAQIPGRGGQATETTFNFKVDGDKLTGTMSGGQGGDNQISDGKVSGDDISFTVKMSFGGNEVKLLYKGKVSGSEIKFTREREGGAPGGGGGGQGGGPGGGGGGGGARGPMEFTAKKAS
jgi:hypothetical protein